MDRTYTPRDITNISRCASFAALAHKGQSRRKNPNGFVPYIVHPARVATLVASFGGSDIAVMASWLHDLEEDCPEVDVAEFIEKELDLTSSDQRMLYEYIVSLTKNVTIIDRMDRLEKHIQMIERSYEAVLIKICDRIDNLTVTQYEDNKTRIEGMKGDSFVQMYVSESDYLLKRLKSKAKIYGYMPAWETLRSMIEEMKDVTVAV